MHKILIVEDDIDLSELMGLHLKKNSYEVASVCSSLEALEYVKNNEVDLILLDIMLPDIEGTDICIEIRKIVYCPIIFMSAIDDPDYIIRAFANGGDDYITKPINYPLLHARIEAALRRSYTYSKYNMQEQVYKFGSFELNFHDRVLLDNGQMVFLSPTQINLLMYLLEHRDQVVTYDNIFKDIWHQNNIGDLRSLAVHISNIRSILRNSECIVSVRGLGYKFDSSKI